MTTARMRVASLFSFNEKLPPLKVIMEKQPSADEGCCAKINLRRPGCHGPKAIDPKLCVPGYHPVCPMGCR
jgi:hypothetical protein